MASAPRDTFKSLGCVVPATTNLKLTAALTLLHLLLKPIVHVHLAGCMLYAQPGRPRYIISQGAVCGNSQQSLKRQESIFCSCPDAQCA